MTPTLTGTSGLLGLRGLAAFGVVGWVFGEAAFGEPAFGEPAFGEAPSADLSAMVTDRGENIQGRCWSVAATRLAGRTVRRSGTISGERWERLLKDMNFHMRPGRPGGHPPGVIAGVSVADSMGPGTPASIP